MKNRNNEKIYENLGIPNELIIKEHKYTFKTPKMSGKEFIQRCQFRTCKSQITIDKDNNLKKLSNIKDGNTQYIKGKHEYTCS